MNNINVIICVSIVAFIMLFLLISRLGGFDWGKFGLKIKTMFGKDGYSSSAELTINVGKKSEKEKQEKDNTNNYQDLKLENKTLKDKHQGLINANALNKISKNNPKINSSINEENLSKLATVRDEIAMEIKKSYSFAFYQFVKENFVKLLSSNFKELKEKGWDIRLNKEDLKRMVWELKTFRNFRNS